MRHAHLAEGPPTDNDTNVLRWICTKNPFYAISAALVLVRLDVIEHHRYTLELHLTYCMTDSHTGGPSPSAWLRLYRDAHVAEATHCHPGQRLWRELGPFPPANTIFQQRMRMASFLSRWLEYLGEQGHSRGTLAVTAEALPHCA